jgi:putative SOS response-associated peptidase YedK
LTAVELHEKSADIEPLHDRMPVIMAPDHFSWWLKDDD